MKWGGNMDLLSSDIGVLIAIIVTPIVFMFSINKGVSEWIKFVPKTTFAQSYWCCLILILLTIVIKRI